MKEATSFVPKMLYPEQEVEQKEPVKIWLRQKQEPAKWYLRFRRYLDMGPKRSLRATVASEPQEQKAGKGNKNQTKDSEQKISDVSVPGAWSRAAKVWNWKERAEAFDLAQLEEQAKYIRQVVVHQPFASKAYRLFYLCGMANGLHKMSEWGFSSVEENAKYIKTMQSLFKDIEQAMQGMDETTLMMVDASAYNRYMENVNKQKAKS